MVKTKVQDLASEFGVPTEQLMSLLREMHVVARGPLQPLDDAQVAAIRLRWEREKRKQAAAPEEPKKAKRRTTKATKAAETAAPAAEASTEAKPAKRRRTAAEVAESEAAQAEADKAALEAQGLDLEKPLVFERIIEAPSAPMPTLEERARALFKELPPPSAEEAEAAPPAEPEPPAEPVVAKVAPPPPPPLPPIPPRLPRPTLQPATPPADGEAAGPRKPFIPPRVQRAPTGPRPVFSSTGGAANRDRPAGDRGGSFNRPGGGTFNRTGPGARPGGPPRPGGPQRPGGPPRAGGPGRPGGPPGAGGPPQRNFGPDAPARGAGGRKKGKKSKKNYVDQDAVQANILKTLAGMKGGPRKRRSDEPSYRDLLASKSAEEREREKTRIRVNEFISVSELADAMKIPATQIVQFAFKEMGMMVTVNQRLDFDQIELIASEFGFQAMKEEEYAADMGATPESDDADVATVPRPPIVTIMGHVDHGKTSLLDHIRKTNVVAGEAGGITQHIGAYHVSLPNGRNITFLDTPGHEAFTAMRTHGAQVTDIVVLVIAADDQVMPQTIEAISHAKNAGVPIIVAINKIDLPTANVQKVKQDLLQHQVVLEEFGGNVLSAQISAKKGLGIDQLMEQVLLQAEILDLKANPDAEASGTVLEATLDPGKGPLATVLVQRGTLRLGDNFICGKFSGRVRAMSDERGKAVKEVGPSIPVRILGFEGVPAAGDTFVSVADALEARDIAQKRQRLDREAQNRRSQRGTSLEDISRQLKAGQVTQLKIIIKADQGGPAEALADALAQLSTSEVRVDVIHRGVGAITESDVLLAATGGAIVLGFHVRPDANARAMAEREHVDIRTYRIIYEAVEDVRAALEGLLKPEQKEIVLGEAEVLETFKVSKIGTIAGCMVRSGTIVRTGKARVVRDGKAVYAGALSSLKRFKDDVKEVKEGLECGIGIENFNDVKVGDRIEVFRVEEVRRTLGESPSATS
ncbi:MAG: translation initiation factor IF-2 [Gemmatimonadales bacterium]|nr:translation initiation factor IF-2 [Gemmatimonadales bacterium]